MIRYRFKTKEEFIDEFGIDWRIKVDWTYSEYYDDGMNCFFGIEISNDKITDKIFRIDGWWINHKMYKEINNKPNYNDKKILVYD